MTDTTDKALDALIDDYRGIMLRHIKTSDGHHMTRALQSRRLVKFDQIVAALRSQLATARADAVREIRDLLTPDDLDSPETAAHCRYALRQIALIDTPAPSAPSPLSLKSLEGVPQEERERRRDAEFARRGWTQPSPEAVAPEDAVDILADLDKAAGEGEILAKAAAQLIRQLLSTPSPEAVARAALERAEGLCEPLSYDGAGDRMCKASIQHRIRALASDPATIAAIITKAGGGE
jgi:hypothetical protein